MNLVAALLLCFLSSSEAETFANRFHLVNGMAIDRQTNLIWARCSVGQTWDKNTCKGKPKGFSFAAAQKLSTNIWRVPTKDELESLISNNGQVQNLDTNAFPKTAASNQLYWSSKQVDESSAWYADFTAGVVDKYYGDYSFLKEKFFVRLVRSQ